MLKVFLVEDEYVVREGIKYNIDWLSEGFIFCGEAGDGELAYPIIKSKQPDIIITDIKMPFMDGLELSRIIKNEMPQCKIIILSGHEEFSYAQEAMKIGVTEYLLKPINSIELISAVNRVAEQILAERKEKNNIERYMREMESGLNNSKHRLFDNIVSGSFSITQILDSAKKLDIDLGAQFYQVALLRCDINDSAEHPDTYEKIRKLDTYFGNIIIFDRGIEGLAILIKGDSIEQLDRIRKEYLYQLERILLNNPIIYYFVGIGVSVDRLTRLSESYESASHALSMRFIMENNAIVNYNDIATNRLFINDVSTLEVAELTGDDLKKLEAFLKSGESHEIPFFVDQFLKSIGSASEKSLLFRQYIIMDIYFTAILFLKEIGNAETLEEALKKPDIFNEAMGDPKKAREFIVHIITTCIRIRDEIGSGRYIKIIEQAKAYMKEHYSDEEMSLNDVAAYISISPNHFSSIFSRQTGKSFINYLTELRMNKAKELLKCSDLRCSDIAVAVGYKDSHYFSYIFKKTQSYTPMQYRSSK